MLNKPNTGRFDIRRINFRFLTALLNNTVRTDYKLQKPAAYHRNTTKVDYNGGRNKSEMTKWRIRRKWTVFLPSFQALCGPRFITWYICMSNVKHLYHFIHSWILKTLELLFKCKNIPHIFNFLNFRTQKVFLEYDL